MNNYYGSFSNGGFRQVSPVNNNLLANIQKGKSTWTKEDLAAAKPSAKKLDLNISEDLEREFRCDHRDVDTGEICVNQRNDKQYVCAQCGTVINPFISKDKKREAFKIVRNAINVAKMNPAIPPEINTEVYRTALMSLELVDRVDEYGDNAIKVARASAPYVATGGINSSIANAYNTVMGSTMGTPMMVPPSMAGAMNQNGFVYPVNNNGYTWNNPYQQQNNPAMMNGGSIVFDANGQAYLNGQPVNITMAAQQNNPVMGSAVPQPATAVNPMDSGITAQQPVASAPVAQQQPVADTGYTPAKPDAAVLGALLK